MSFNKDESQSNDCVLHLIQFLSVLEIFEISSPSSSTLEPFHLERESKNMKNFTFFKTPSHLKDEDAARSNIQLS